jgi:alpha-glucoside transport system substrate-binding protein
MWRRGSALAAGALGVSLALAGCGGGSSGGNTSASPNDDPTCSKYQAYMGHSGTTVSMFASIISPESDSLEKSWADFSRCTGITISYEGGNNFESQLPVRVAGGTAPDFAIIPQPGLLQKMVKSGKVAKPPQAVVDNVDKYWAKAWRESGSANGTFYAAPMSANMKSFVWYSPKAFTAAGYKAPTTWQELVDLSNKIATAGKGKPWCGGIGSGTATGWPATDWLEEMVLRTGGGDVYDKWVSHDIKFDSPEITKAMEALAGWMKNPAWVNGGFGDVKSIATTTFQDAGKPILTGKCWMLQQANFYAPQWPKGTKIGPDGDVFVFYLPTVNTSVQTPVEFGGEFVTAFSNRPEVQAVQTYLSTPEWATSRIKAASGWVSANNGVDQNVYTDPVDKLTAKYLTDPNATERFDASDLMPAAVGAGSEWKEMTAWFSSGKSTADVLKAIDASWPAS